MNTAAQSQTAWSPNFSVSGGSFIVWGTDGIISSYIVTTANESERVDEIQIENNAGFTAIFIMLLQGLDVEINVVDDTSITPPAFGTVVTLSTPFGNVPMIRVQSKTDQARKREGMRTLSFKSFNAITGLH